MCEIIQKIRFIIRLEGRACFVNKAINVLLRYKKKTVVNPAKASQKTCPSEFLN